MGTECVSPSVVAPRHRLITQRVNTHLHQSSNVQLEEFCAIHRVICSNSIEFIPYCAVPRRCLQPATR